MGEGIGHGSFNPLVGAAHGMSVGTGKPATYFPSFRAYLVADSFGFSVTVVMVL
jgi:hypothetical protein